MVLPAFSHAWISALPAKMVLAYKLEVIVQREGEPGSRWRSAQKVSMSFQIALPSRNNWYEVVELCFVLTFNLDRLVIYEDLDFCCPWDSRGEGPGGVEAAQPLWPTSRPQ